MQTLSKAVTKNVQLGAPMPTVYPVLAEHQVMFRRGASSMLAGPPGSFKSTFALNLTIGWVMKGMAGIYVSADSDHITMGSRCASIITGDAKVDVEKTIRSGAYAEPLNMISSMHCEFRALSVQQLDKRIKAFEAMYGQFPDFIVMDNLMNMVANPGDWNAQLLMCRDLDEVARAAKSHVMILHHTQEKTGTADKPPTEPQPVWDIQGKVNQFSRLTLTLGCASTHLMVAPVKNTNGPQDRTGNTYYDFSIEPGCCRIEELC